MKYSVVLGGMGTIGTQMCRRLKEEGHYVRCVDIKYNEWIPVEADEVMIGDLRDIEFMRKALHLSGNRWTYIFGLMAFMGGASTIFSKRFDSQIMYDSAQMNLNLAKTATEIGVGKVLFSSSACCYPESIQMDDDNLTSLSENMAWGESTNTCGRPDSVYGIEKLFSENLYDSFRRNEGLDIRICRFHNVFSTHAVYDGGREKYPSSLCRKISKAESGDSIEIWGDGKQVRSFLWVDEAITAVLKLMDSDFVQPLNIGSDYPISINDLAKMVIEFSGKDIKIKNVESDVVGVRGRNCDSTLCESVLGWKPTQPLEVGMRKLYEWVNSEVQKNKQANG